MHHKVLETQFFLSNKMECFIYPSRLFNFKTSVTIVDSFSKLMCQKEPPALKNVQKRSVTLVNSELAESQHLSTQGYRFILTKLIMEINRYLLEFINLKETKFLD